MADQTQSGSKYELAGAYVSVMPSLQGMAQALQQQVAQASPQISTSINRAVTSGMNSAAASSGQTMGNTVSSSLRAAVQRSFGGARTAFAGVGTAVYSSLSSGVQRSATLFKDTLVTGAKAGAAALGTATAAVGGQIAAGGLSRAMGINEATAKLHALGYQAAKFTEIKNNALSAVDGTRFSLQESIGAAGQLLAAGVKPGKELEQTLKNVGKLTDMSGTRSYGDIGSMFGKNAASGIVQMEDLNQLIDSGVAILPALGKMYGKTALEVLKMASDGKISFDDFNKAVQQMTFDSTGYAKESVKGSFANLRSSLSKIGADLWAPIVDNAAPVFGKLRSAFNGLRGNTAFKDVVNLIQTNLSQAMAAVDRWSGKLDSAFRSPKVVKDFFDEIFKAYDGFRKATSGAGGPLAGLAAAFGSGAASGLPVIGAFITKINPAVGLMGGALYQMVSQSDGLRAALKRLGGAFSSLFTGMKGTQGKDALKSLGDSLTSVVNGIAGVFTDLSSGKLLGGVKVNLGDVIMSVIGNASDAIALIVSAGPQLGSALQGVITTIAQSLQGSGIDIKSDEIGKKLGSGFITGVTGIITAIQQIIPTVVSIVTDIYSAATSDLSKSIFGAIVDLAQFMLRHKTVLYAFLGMIAGGFLLGGIMRFALQAGSTFLAINRIVTSGASLLGSAASIASLGTVIQSVVTGLVGAGGSVMAGWQPLLAIGAFFLAVGGLTVILQKIGFFGAVKEILKVVIDTVVYLVSQIITLAQQMLPVISQAFTVIVVALTQAWQFIRPVLDWIRDSLLQVFTVIISTITTSLAIIIGRLTELVAQVGSTFAVVTTSVEGLLLNLAANGVQAGVGALAAASGITALAGAMALLASGKVLDSIGNFGASIFNKGAEAISGKTQADPLQQLAALATTISTFSQQVGAMPTQWAIVANTAMGAGMKIMQGFASGLRIGMGATQLALDASIIAMLASLQSTLDQHPLTVTVKEPQISAGALAAYGGGMSTTNTSTYNYNINTQNSSVAKGLIASAR